MSLKYERLFKAVLIAAALAVLACAAVILFMGRAKENADVRDFIDRNNPSEIIFRKTESKAARDRGMKEIDDLVDPLRRRVEQ